MVQLVHNVTNIAIKKALKLEVTVLDTNESREVVVDEETGVACIHDLCEDTRVKIEVKAGEECSGSQTFYRIEPKITNEKLLVDCNDA